MNKGVFYDSHVSEVVIDRENPRIKKAYFRKDAYGNRVRYIYDGELSSSEGVDIIIRESGILFPSIQCGGNLICEPTVVAYSRGDVNANGVIVGGSLVAGNIRCHSIKAVWITARSVETVGDIECRAGIDYGNTAALKCGGTLRVGGEIIVLEETI